MLRIYRSKDSWVLGRCVKCERLNYVEPHGTTAQCKCSKEWTEHLSIPQEDRIDTIYGPVTKPHFNKGRGR